MQMAVYVPSQYENLLFGQRQGGMQRLKIGSAIDQKSKLSRSTYAPAISSGFQNSLLCFHDPLLYRLLSTVCSALMQNAVIAI